MVEVTALPKRGAGPEERVGADGVARDATQSCCAYRLLAFQALAGCALLVSATGKKAERDRWRGGWHIRT